MNNDILETRVSTCETDIRQTQSHIEKVLTLAHKNEISLEKLSVMHAGVENKIEDLYHKNKNIVAGSEMHQEKNTQEIQGLKDRLRDHETAVRAKRGLFKNFSNILSTFAIVISIFVVIYDRFAEHLQKVVT